MMFACIKFHFYFNSNIQINKSLNEYQYALILKSHQYFKPIAKSSKPKQLKYPLPTNINNQEATYIATLTDLMKPNFKPRAQLVKTTFDGQSRPMPKKVQSKKVQDQSQGFQPLGQSLVGERQFIFFDSSNNSSNNSSSNSPKIQANNNNTIEENMSLIGTTEKVFFTNASSVNRDQFQKDKQLHEQISAFRPSQKLVREQPPKPTFTKKAKSTATGANRSNNSQQASLQQEQDENEFLALNNVGKWQKGNKSTVVSEEMKKMHSHLENRLTETKWVKKKPSGHGGCEAKTEKNPSTMKSNDSGSFNSEKVTPAMTRNDSIKIVASSTQPSSQQQPSQTSPTPSQKPTLHHEQQQAINVKKGAQKYMQGMTETAKVRLSSMTSWKEEDQQEKKKEEVDDEVEDEQQEEEESEEQEEEDEQEQSEEQEDEQEEQQDEEEEGDQEDGEEQEESSGEEGWDQPQQKEEPEDQEEKKEDPFAVPEPQSIEEKTPTKQVKPKKWGSKIDSQQQSQVNDPNTQPIRNNPSIKIEPNTKMQDEQEHQQEEDNPDQIQDLTEGQIPNEQVDPNWEKIEQILLRIQKLVN